MRWKRSMGASEQERVEMIDAVLPQTQCRLCRYAGCRAYAQALAHGEAGTDRCAPGGERVARELAALMGAPFKPVDPRYGETKPRALAVIDESVCIGCTLCIQACPVDAIVGAAKLMHTVIAADCTGCELCVAPCPVDCIRIEPARELAPAERRSAADRARMLFQRREARLQCARSSADASAETAASVKRRILERVVARARVRLAKRP